MDGAFAASLHSIDDPNAGVGRGDAQREAQHLAREVGTLLHVQDPYDVLGQLFCSSGLR
jgi:hypothetical protein